MTIYKLDIKWDDPDFGVHEKSQYFLSRAKAVEEVKRVEAEEKKHGFPLGLYYKGYNLKTIEVIE